LAKYDSLTKISLNHWSFQLHLLMSLSKARREENLLTKRLRSCQELGWHILKGISMESLPQMKASDSPVRLNFRIAIHHHLNIFKPVLMSRKKSIEKRSKNGINWEYMFQVQMIGTCFLHSSPICFYSIFSFQGQDWTNN